MAGADVVNDASAMLGEPKAELCDEADASADEAGAVATPAVANRPSARPAAMIADRRSRRVIAERRSRRRG